MKALTFIYGFKLFTFTESEAGENGSTTSVVDDVISEIESIDSGRVSSDLLHLTDTMQVNY